MRSWNGIFPAVTTKMSTDGSLDLAACNVAIERLIQSGVSGVIVLPMLGENACLEQNEREAVIRGAVEVAAGRVPVLSGLAEISLAKAKTNAKAYETYGAQGLMVFPSLAYKTDPRETVAWYKSIASACALPIMIYNNPAAYGVDVTPAILKALANTPQIVSIKEETGDARRVTDIFVELGNRFDVFCGVDDLIVESVALGVTGWVSGMANAWPVECLELYGLCQTGRFPEARELYQLMTPALHLDTHLKLVQYVKLAESVVAGAPEGVREPRLPIDGAEREAVLAIIKETIAKLDSRKSRLAARLAASTANSPPCEQARR